MAIKRTDTTSTSKLEVTRKGGKIFSHVRNTWLIETPEERVRQQYLCVLVNEYGYSLDQIDEEINTVGRGTGKARADFVIWRTVADKNERKTPFIVVECKSDNVRISSRDYGQGENYARLTNAPFFVTHNSSETRFWRVLKDRMPGYIEEIEALPSADSGDDEIATILSKLKVFKEDEFATLLHECHNIIRNRDHLDPAAAFDEIAKILFIKMLFERQMRAKRTNRNLFTVEALEAMAFANPIEALFTETKEKYKADRIFLETDKINLKPSTATEIVKLLERYDLSSTSEDVKGIAFERFLGRTFRGEIGQFFTPRPIVEFAVQMINPLEGEVFCDPAIGSGGFAIRVFEIVRERILADADREYQDYKTSIEASGFSEEQAAECLRVKYDELQSELDPTKRGSRMWKLANECIFGTDANDRMARTSKMNMIMHGDGHGGVYHHNGFLNTQGIFPDRFDIILTNPPFGARVEPSDVITAGDIKIDDEEFERAKERYGDAFVRASAELRAAQNKPILSLYKLPKSDTSKVKTEILFIERCLDLLKPGGRLGIVLPEGVFNNPSLEWVREFCEDRAFIQAVVSLPEDTFESSKASVKVSLLFAQKYTIEQQADYDAKKIAAQKEISEKYTPEIEAETQTMKQAIALARGNADMERAKTLQREMRGYLQHMTDLKEKEARALLKERFSYPIFMYQANRVGITATGEADDNELYPNDRKPPTISETCVELYRRFRSDPDKFMPERIVG